MDAIMLKRAASILITILLAVPLVTNAAFFNLNNVITDSELTDNNVMSLSRIQSFLRDKGSYLANYITDGLDGPTSAAEIIYGAANLYELSPKYFLVRIQVEQSLVNNSSPTQQQLDRAAGYGCPDNSSCDPDYKGFFNQIYKSAEAIRGIKYLGGIAQNGTTISGWGPRITKTTLDGITITPENAATAVLYTYTPWVGKYGGGDQSVGGTSLFARLWQEWFTRHYPDGTLVQEYGSNGVYLIQNGKKKPIWNRTTLLANYDPNKIIIVTGNELGAYEDGPPIRFPNNVLLQSPKGTVYIIVNGEKRGIVSKEVLRGLGFNPEEIIPASWNELNSIPNGDPVTESDIYPTGILLQSKQTGGVSYIENGIRHSIWSKEILRSRFKNRAIVQVDQAEIDSYQSGDPVKFKDGELVTAHETNAVYVISNGEKRPFKSAEALNALGYKWENIIYTSEQALNIHPMGKSIDID
ncbi:MAG: hypothetical protein COT24_05560 [Candidatus Kerfeldbacteria bacterium CG08_land_8_20_14_0_20_40_16]|uniref:Uncharacterized protein n=1 Tax=Candidatus Kerfeldbacteria bacterium CG08_land_8_20_14_0_20_40_16 TaxID=2014244 RepID=A0A2H0YU84_9BACT|nr:MAG: hypothetical protein COT24_05560 [Candidatus Kerfeldbacteria bacterium CG08_land_8_20_14_0_20_40_16]